MDPLRAFYDLFRLGARFAEARHRAARALRRVLAAIGLGIGLLMVSIVGLCWLLFAADQALIPKVGSAYAALIVAAALFVIAGLLGAAIGAVLKSPKPAPVAPAAATPPRDEMSTAAMLALVGGMVMGSVLQARKDKAAP